MFNSLKRLALRLGFLESEPEVLLYDLWLIEDDHVGLIAEAGQFDAMSELLESLLEDHAGYGQLVPFLWPTGTQCPQFFDWVQHRSRFKRLHQPSGVPPARVWP